MKRFRKLLVGIDCSIEGRISGAARRAFEQARSLASYSGAEIALLHSTWHPDSPLLAGVPAPSTEPATRAMDALLADLARHGIQGSAVLTEERPWLALSRHVLDGYADLVLIGRGGENTGHRPGSTATKMLRKCPGAVWLVHPAQRGQPTRILAATDLTEVGSLAVALAGSLADLNHAELHVLHAFGLPFELQVATGRVAPADLEQRKQEILDRAREQILSSLGEEISTHPNMHLVQRGSSEAIMEAYEALLPDVLVMGTVSRVGIPGMVVGNTAEKVLPRLPGSLLTVKPADFVSPITQAS